MIKSILLIICLIPTMLGVSEILHWLRLLILAPEKKPITYTVVCLTSDSAKEQIRFAAAKYSNSGHKNIIAVNSSVEEQDINECKEIADKNDIIFCSAEELCKDIKQITNWGN